MQDNNWLWIPRNVEPTVEKWIKMSALVILMRGQRRSGKSSTVKHCAEKLGKEYIVLQIKPDDTLLIAEAKKVLVEEHISGIHDLRPAILNQLKAGRIVIIEELQNSSYSLLVVLQQLCDDMAFQSMHHLSEWERSGSLFLMGSIPSLVDKTLGSRESPLY